MSKGHVWKLGILLGSLALGACEDRRQGSLLDGCYYLDGKAILSLQGAAGIVRIPGNVSHFRLIPRGSSGDIWMTTQPSFVIGGSDKKFVRDAGTLSSPVIIVEDTNPTASRILIRDNGQVVRLTRQNSCLEERARR